MKTRFTERMCIEAEPVIRQDRGCWARRPSLKKQSIAVK
jgi:hypothetical protein